MAEPRLPIEEPAFAAVDKEAERLFPNNAEHWTKVLVAGIEERFEVELADDDSLREVIYVALETAESIGALRARDQLAAQHERELDDMYGLVATLIESGQSPSDSERGSDG